MNTQIEKEGNNQEKGNITIEKNNRHKTLEERAEAFNGKIGPYEEFDWGEPVGREVL